MVFIKLTANSLNHVSIKAVLSSQIRIYILIVVSSSAKNFRVYRFVFAPFISKVRHYESESLSIKILSRQLWFNLEDKVHCLNRKVVTPFSHDLNNNQ